MSVRQIISLGLIAAALAGCGDKEIETVKSDVTNNLKDPQSAQFKDVKKYSEGVICGSVNAKNAMGGYVGFSPFIFNGRQSNYLDMVPISGDVSIFCNDLPKKRVTMAKRAHGEKLFVLSMFVENKTQCVNPKSHECKLLNEGKADAKRVAEEFEKKVAAAEASYK